MAVAAALGVASAASLLAQQGGEALELPSLVGWFGAATPFALVLLYWLRRESQRADRWERLYLDVADRSAKDVLPALAEATRLHGQTIEVLTDVSTRPSPDVALLTSTERAIRDLLDRVERLR